jgi:hypothetical protein
MFKINYSSLVMAIFASALLTTNVHAVIINDSMTFATQNQSMWAEGKTSTWSAQTTFLGEKWGTYDGNSARAVSIDAIIGSLERNVCIGIEIAGNCGGPRTDVDTRTGVAGGIKSSGQIGIVPFAKASGGGIDVTLPVEASIVLPDAISSNTIFRVTTAGGSQAGSTISAKAPSFQAGVDGVFDSENELWGKACLVFAGCSKESFDIDINAGRFSLIDFDTSKNNPLSMFGVSVPVNLFDNQFTIHAPSPSNPDGVDDDVSPQTLPTPIVGSIIFRNPDDKSGGVLSGNAVSLKTNQNIFEAKLSITGIIESVIGSPGILRNDISIVGPIKAEYTIADVQVGPVFGLQQEFDLDPRLMVQLAFDTPVTRMVEQIKEYHIGDVNLGSKLGSLAYDLQVRKNSDGTGEWCFSFTFGSPVCGPIARPTGPQACFDIDIKFGALPPIQFEQCMPSVPIYETVAQTHENGIVDIILGNIADLRFEGEVGQLISRKYFLDNPIFRNETAATIDPAIQVQLLCAGFTGLGDKCVYDETFQTDGLFALPVYENQWVLAGFKSVSYDDVYRLGSSGNPDEDPNSDNPKSDDPIDVPEPSALWLILLGLVVIMLSLRRNNKAVIKNNAIVGE